MPRRSSSPRAPGAYLPFPLWVRFTISSTIAVVLLVALVVFVNGHNTNSPALTNATTAVQANREAEVLIAQDQAPHTARLSAVAAPASGLLRVLRAYVSGQIARGAISGPLQRGTCQPTSPPGQTRRAYSCTVLTGSVEYHFVAAVDHGSHRVIYCKRDPPPAPSDVVPVSPRCLG